ncbi:hypothetical protein [Streptomyces sp. T028]|uniref:hypothetical protein n=1 Tax=Streptomyces sp. T028 TaxID=3394379 RepID=UPI003A840218
MATSDEWSRVGFTGNPVSGNPGVVENITKELRDLADLAGRVSGGLDTLLTKAEDGGFEGRTADALRTYVKDELKTFMANINRSFDMAAGATARYARALGDSQDRAENAADTVAALERVGGEPLPENDPEMTRARNEVDAEMDAVQAEAKILEDALHEASRLVSRPVKKPKKSFWKRFVSTFFKVLEIVALVITLVAAVIGGPLGLVAFGLGAVLFAKALVDYAMGNGNALSLGLAFLGILFPSTKGLTTIGGLARMASSGTKALSGALSASGRLLFRGGRMLMSSPGRLLSLAGQGLVRFGGGLAGRAGGGFMALPRVLSKAPAMVGSTLRFMGRFARSSFRQGWSALSRDFYQSTAFITGNTATKIGVFTIMSLGRLTTSALLPMRYSEIAQFGYRGAARMGFISRGTSFTSKGSGVLTRTGSLAGDLMDVPGRNLDRGGTLRPFDGTGADKLAVPGTPEFSDTLDELADVSLTPTTTTRAPDFSRLSSRSPVRMPGRLDDMGGRLSTLDNLDAVGLPVGTVPGGQRLGLLTPVNERLRLLDPMNGRVGDDLLPPPTALDELRDLDTLTGMERTSTGLLRPLDGLADLSLDGRLGGLSETQVRQVMDGEIDLVRITPDGVVMRIGKTDPVDVRVQLKDGVRIEALGPADPKVPTLNRANGTDGLDGPGIEPADLTRLLPDTGDGSRTARELLGLGPVRTDVATPPAAKPLTALTLRDIVTGGATGKLGTQRFQTWLRTQSAQFQLDTAGRKLGELDRLTDVPPLSRAQAELDLSAAEIDLNQARIAFARLGMNLDTVRRDVTVMMTRVDSPAAGLPTGELRLLDDQLRLHQLDLGGTRGFDDMGSQVDDLGHLSDDFRFDRFDAPVPRTDTVVVDPADFAGVTGFRTEWQRTPLQNGGFTFTDQAGDIRLVFDAGEVRQFTDIRIPGGDSFVRFDADPGPGSLPRVVGQDGVALPGGATIEPVRGALGVVTGARVQSLDGAWMARFELDGTRLSEQLTLSGTPTGRLTGSRLTTTFTQLPGGTQSATFRLAVPGLGDGAFDVVRLDGDLAQRLPGGFSVTDRATGARFVFDRGGRFVDLPADGTPSVRLDVSGSATPDTTVSPPSTLGDLGDLGRIGASGDLGDVGRLGDLGDVGDLSRLGDLGDLGRVGDLGEVGSLNRLSLPDPPRTDLTPGPAGFDTRFTANVGDGAPTPVDLSRFDGMRLSGAPELTNLRLQVTEFPATDLAPASFRIDVVDFGAPGGPVRLENVNVTLREGGGLSITGSQGGARWHFDAFGRLEFPLAGTDLALRFSDEALNQLPRVVGPDGLTVQGATITPVRDAAGALSELTVRVPVPDTDGLTTVWRFEPGGTLRGQELPLTLPGLDGPAGLGVKVTITPGTGGTTTRVLELTGPSNLTGSFRLGPLDGGLAGRLPNGFTVTDTATGSRFHFDAGGRLATRDILAPDGSGFLRFTQDAAPGTPPVRLDELGDLGDFPGDLGDVARIFERTLDEAGGVRGPLDDLNRLDDVSRLDDLSPLTGPDAPRTDALPGLDHLGPAERALVDDLWNNLTQPVSADDLNRLLATDSPPRTDALSELGELGELGDLSDTELDALRARLDNVRQLDGGPQGADEPFQVPLSGVDDLADFDLRVSRLPATDDAPQGSYRLELTDRTPGGTGPVRASDFTVELLDGSGRFAVIDPTGTTRFTFGPDGTFLGRESVLTVDGLPEGLRLSVTIDPMADGTGRATVDLLVPSGATGSVRFTPTSGPLAARLPSGFTLTDTVTGSRFHFDHTGRLAFRDLPDRDGSGLLRFTEGAAPGTPPVRLDELGDFGRDVGERFPLDSVPEDGVLDGVLDGIDLARVFDRTLDEASGFRTLPEGAPADLSDVGRAMDFLEPDSHVVQSLDVPGVHRLADGATESLNRLGLGPELIDDQLRNLTGQTRLALRQQAVTTLGQYLDLPREMRLDDHLQSALHGGGGRVVGDFTVRPTPRGSGPGGSHFTVHHNPSDVTLGFDANRGLVHQEVFLRGGPADLDGLKLGVTGRSADGGPWTPTAVDFVGARPADDLFTVAPSTEVRGGLTLTDEAGTTRWHYGPEGVHAFRDVDLPGDRGVLRFEVVGAPQALDSAGHQLPGFRTEMLDDGRIALVPTGKGAQPLERTVFDPAGKPVEETVAIRGTGGKPTGEYWNIDHVAGEAVRTDADGTPFSGRFDTATVERSGTGQFKLTGTGPGKVTLFEREVFKNGNVLHLDRNRFGRARWTEFDSAGDTFRHGRRIGDADMRTFHDVPDGGSWRRLIDNSGDVRTYTKGIDGGLVRAEKEADGHWTWQRFDKAGAESLSGTRHWSWDHVGFRDTFADPATGIDTVAQRRGRTWPFSGEHGSRMYVEHSVVPGHAPAGGRIAPDTYTGFGGANVQLESLETLADGGSLLVKRYADMRPPAFLWKSAAGRSPFDGFFRDLFAGDSLHRVSHWTQTAADGTEVTGVRLNPTGAHWVDIDQYGRVVRETRKLDNGNVVEVGRSLDDPKQWAALPEYRKGGSYELSWRDTTSGTTGTRHVDGYGRWRDLFTDDLGVERVRLRSEVGGGTREYLFEAPSTRDLTVNDNAGTWVDRNSLMHITGRRDLIDGRIVESSGSPYRTSWTWRAYSPEDPTTAVAEGVRKQNRGSFYSKTWDDSFVDLDGLGNPIRERNATDVGSSWVDAVKQANGDWKWTKTTADGTVHSGGTRVYDDIADGTHWRDLVDGQVVRQREGGRVREFDYKIIEPEPPAALPEAPTLQDMLAHSARHFEPPKTVEVNTQVWKEYDVGKVFRERVAVDGTPGRFREVDKQWGQWREFQDGHLVEQRTFTGRVWKTDAFGRLSTSGPAVIPEYLAGALPRMGDGVGLPGDVGWKLIGRETDFRGWDIEAMGLLREVQDPWHGVLQGVRDGVSAEMPVWQRELRAALTTFSTGFVTDFTAGLAVTAATNDGKVKLEDVYKALLSGSVGGTFSGGLNILYNRTPLGYYKMSMGARDWGGHPKQSMATNTDDWATEFSAQEKPTRWRTATYANTVGIGTSALSGFVSNAISAAVFGVNGNEVKGADALLAGLWGAGSFAFSGVTTGLARNAFHLTTAGRLFHKGGISELGMNWTESFLARYINFWITEADKKDGTTNLPAPGRSFPTAPTTPATPPSTPAPPEQQQPASDPAALLTDGLEFP